MNPLFLLVSGHATAAAVGIAIAVEYGIALGIAVYYPISVLVDIRYELEKVNAE